VELEESDLSEAQSAPTASAGAARYEAALVALRDGRAAEAERELLAFAESEPTSDLADNAWFWLAESRLARGDTAGAIEAYRTTIDRYPEGNKIPDALLKLGVALEAGGNLEAAREAWRELVRRFPTSAASEIAAARLERP
jgi:tol-pal system protein YbgF